MSPSLSHQYKLTKDLPKYKKGWTLKWSGSRRLFFPYLPSEWKMDEGKESINLDYKHQGYSFDEIRDREWFEPAGKFVDFIPKFPSKENIKEYFDLLPEGRLVQDVDEARAITDLLDDKTFQDELYEFYKDKYNKFHKLNK